MKRIEQNERQVESGFSVGSGVGRVGVREERNQGWLSDVCLNQLGGWRWRMSLRVWKVCETSNWWRQSVGRTSLEFWGQVLNTDTNTRLKQSDWFAHGSYSPLGSSTKDRMEKKFWVLEDSGGGGESKGEKEQGRVSKRVSMLLKASGRQENKECGLWCFNYKEKEGSDAGEGAGTWGYLIMGVPFSWLLFSQWLGGESVQEV